jgi:hypothetical protein
LIAEKGVLNMGFWIGMGVLIYILFIILEESVYSLWNRYVYGAKDKKVRIWKNTMTMGIAFIRRLQIKEIQEKLTKRISSH